MPSVPEDEPHFFSTRTRNVSGGKLRRRRMVMGKERKRRSSRKNERGESVRTLISGGRIQKKIREMARKIRSDFPEEPLHLVGVLKGAVFFLSDLARQIPGEVSFDFIAVSSYGKETQSSGQVKLTRDRDANIEGKRGNVVEDILHRGLTLEDLQRVSQRRKPKQLRVAGVLDKHKRRIAAGRADYVGFTVPHDIVGGYGLEYH